MRGMSETSGLTLDELKSVERDRGHRGAVARAAAVFGHRGLGRLLRRPLVYGRNYDYLPWFRELDDDLVLACFHPATALSQSLRSATLARYTP